MAKAAHWSRVTKSIAKKYNLPWKTAKAVYDKVRSENEKTPSLRAVKELPQRLRKAHKVAAEKRIPKLARKAKQRSEKPKPERVKLPKGVELAPPPPGRAKARKVPDKQSARNDFQRSLLENGLPIKALTESPLGRELKKNWTGEKSQERLIKTIAKGFRQIKRMGGMQRKTRQQIEKLLTSMLGVRKGELALTGILAQLYGPKPKSK